MLRDKSDNGSELSLGERGQTQFSEAEQAYLEGLRTQFLSVPFWALLGCNIGEIGNGSADVSLLIQSDLINGNGTVHGGVYATLLDNAMGLAVRTLGYTVATMSMNVHFLGGAKAGHLFAKGEVVHMTRKTATTKAVLLQEDGELVALGTGSFRLFDKVFAVDKRMGP